MFARGTKLKKDEKRVLARVTKLKIRTRKGYSREVQSLKKEEKRVFARGTKLKNDAKRVLARAAKLKKDEKGDLG